MRDDRTIDVALYPRGGKGGDDEVEEERSVSEKGGGEGRGGQENERNNRLERGRAGWLAVLLSCPVLSEFLSVLVLVLCCASWCLTNQKGFRRQERGLSVECFQKTKRNEMKSDKDQGTLNAILRAGHSKYSK